MIWAFMHFNLSDYLGHHGPAFGAYPLPHCKSNKPMNDIEQQTWQALVSPWKATPDTINHAVGCEHCRNTGYLGRVGLYEIMVLSNALKNCWQADFVKSRKKPIKMGCKPLRLAAKN